MNLRPPGYEPDELPSCSTPRHSVAFIGDIDYYTLFQRFCQEGAESFLQQKQRMKTRLLTFFEPLPVKRTMKKTRFFAKSHNIPRVSKCPRILPLGRCQCSGLHATCSVSYPHLPACGEKHDLCTETHGRYGTAGARQDWLLQQL